MEIQEIISFITVVEQKSFSKAATKLGYSKSSITIHIKNLETELNVQLFERLGKQITLTKQGEIFYQDAMSIIDSTQNAKDHLKLDHELTGTIKIGTIDSLSTTKLPRIIETLHRKHPRMKITIITDTIQGLLNKLSHNDIDLAYLFDIPIQDYSYIQIPIKQHHTTFVTSLLNPLALKKSITIEDILKSDLILTEKDASYRLVLDQMMAKHDIHLTPYFQAQSTEIILNLLGKNMGISYLPEYVIVDRHDLIALKTDFDQIMDEQILYHKDKKITREMDAFLTILKDESK